MAEAAAWETELSTLQPRLQQAQTAWEEAQAKAGTSSLQLLGHGTLQEAQAALEAQMQAAQDAQPQQSLEVPSLRSMEEFHVDGCKNPFQVCTSPSAALILLLSHSATSAADCCWLLVLRGGWAAVSARRLLLQAAASKLQHQAVWHAGLGQDMG